MKRLLIIVIVSFLFFHCNNNIPARQSSQQKYIIDQEMIFSPKEISTLISKIIVIENRWNLKVRIITYPYLEIKNQKQFLEREQYAYNLFLIKSVHEETLIYNLSKTSSHFSYFQSGKFQGVDKAKLDLLIETIVNSRFPKGQFFSCFSEILDTINQLYSVQNPK